jgi:hypothetical protein
MDEESEEKIGRLYEVLEKQAVALASVAKALVRIEARIDVVEHLHLNNSRHAMRNPSAFRSFRAKLYEACYQRRLEKLEDEDPALAARADARAGLPDLDPEIMEQLRQAYRRLEEERK